MTCYLHNGATQSSYIYIYIYERLCEVKILFMIELNKINQKR